MRKKKIVFNSNSSLAKSGFGKHMRILLSYLYKTGKYEIIEYAAGPLNWSHPICRAMPWKAYGALPDNPRELDQYQDKQPLLHAANYGYHNIDKLMQLEKPDVFMAIEDIWGIPYFDKPWWNKIPCISWTPIDSLPLLPIFTERRGQLKHLWVKAVFAKNALDKIGVRSEYMPALIENDQFRQYSLEEKKELRKKFGLSENTLIFGFVFRNQIRKLVDTLIEGFSIFKKQNPEVPAKLWLHTNWIEQWNIPRLIEEFGVNPDDVLTTYVCQHCKDYRVKSFTGNDLNCTNCGEERSSHTAGIALGVSEKELCELYNICDAYIHPATSGGFEFPIAEAMFCGLPIATVDYSFGENFTCNPEVYKLDYIFYKDVNTLFNKAQVLAPSIANFMQEMAQMSPQDRWNLGKSIRDWSMKEFDCDTLCKKVETFLDELPLSDYDFNFSDEKNENYPMPEGILDEREFIQNLYLNILRMDISANPAETQNGLSLFQQGLTQEQVYQRFIEVARAENQKNRKLGIEDFIDKESAKKRLIFVMPRSIGDCFITLSVLEGLLKSYPLEEWDHYVATEQQNFQIFSHLTYLKNILPYDPIFDDVYLLEGRGDHKGFFDIAFHPYFETQRQTDYHKNGNFADQLQIA